VHATISAGLVRACHDLSEGGLAVAIAEMAFAGGCGARVDLKTIAASGGPTGPAVTLFSESNTRFLCEVRSEHTAEFERMLAGLPRTKIGDVTADGRLTIRDGATPVIDADATHLKKAWQATFHW
jgi:phosphoribosylformylglycinamidine synthase